jgi:hypothetical protein
VEQFILLSAEDEVKKYTTHVFLNLAFSVAKLKAGVSLCCRASLT